MICILIRCQFTSMMSEHSFITIISPPESTQGQSSNNSWSHFRKAKTHSSVQLHAVSGKNGSNLKKINVHCDFEYSGVPTSPLLVGTYSHPKYSIHQLWHAQAISLVRCILDALHVWNTSIPRTSEPSQPPADWGATPTSIASHFLEAHDLAVEPPPVMMVSASTRPTKHPYSTRNPQTKEWGNVCESQMLFSEVDL